MKAELHAIVQHEGADTLNGRANCCQLGDNALAIATILDHLLNAANLPLNPPQPLQ